MAKSKFIKLTLKDHIIVHGYDDNHVEIQESIIAENFSEKIIAVDRIKSLSEQYVLTDYIEGRWIYWEYKESFKSVSKFLLKQ